MRALLLLFFLLPTLASAQHAVVSGRVVDSETGAAIPFAHVVETHSGRAVAADASGAFSLHVAPGSHALRATAVGFAPRSATVTAPAEGVVIALHAAPLSGETVVVESRAPAASDLSAPTTFAATEDLLARVPGVDLLQRGAYAWEPAIRGMQAGRVGVTIDGMQVVGACVDRMDPATSYVEPENLERVDVARGATDLMAGSRAGGSLDLVTARPTFGGTPRAQVEVGGGSNALDRRVRGWGEASHGRFAVRASASARAADDLRPGGGEALAHSGYAKRNAALALAADLGGGHTVGVRGLLDDAWLVGYPVLLMDATLAQMNLLSAEWTFHAETTHAEARAYRSRIDHLMDDRFRDVMARTVMRGMYMPMAGHTETWGLVGEASRALGGFDVALGLDLHRTEQFGDMEMISLYPGIPDMYLLNVGTARATNLGVTLRGARALGPVTLRADARLDATTRDIRRTAARTLFRDRLDGGDPARALAAPSLSLRADAALAPGVRAHLAAARASRLPTLVEHYGHYVYDYADGFFYTGNPRLGAETSRQAEAGLAWTGRVHALRASAFVNRLDGFIAGIEDDGLTGSATYRFRRYADVGRATLFGGEASALVRLTDRTEAVGSVAYTRGHRADLDEPLPQIAPVGGTALVRHRQGRVRGEAEVRWAGPQNRVARRASLEVPTDGYAVLGLRGEADLGRGVVLHAGVENVFDTFYRQHSAIGQMPSAGRSFTLALAARLGG